VRWQAYGVNFSSLVFAGRDGRDGLAAAGLAIMLSNVTMEAVAWGMLTALETLGAQAFGAGNFRRVGVVTQRAAVVLAVAAVWRHCGSTCSRCCWRCGSLPPSRRSCSAT
jgi:MATE family multidrug resistance protein